MWEHNAQTTSNPIQQSSAEPMQNNMKIKECRESQDEGDDGEDAGEEGPSCNSEDYPGINDEEREDTEIDFIQQVDTDRQMNQDQDVDHALPVNNEN